MHDKIIGTRNMPEIAESVGFLCGTEEEKVTPWLAAITDNLEVLHKNHENAKAGHNAKRGRYRHPVGQQDQDRYKRNNANLKRFHIR